MFCLIQIVEKLESFNKYLAQMESEPASAVQLKEMAAALQSMETAMTQRFASIEVKKSLSQI